MAIKGEGSVDADIVYSYTVTFNVQNDVKWSSRWDYILESTPHTNIQWFSILQPRKDKTGIKKIVLADCETIQTIQNIVLCIIEP